MAVRDRAKQKYFGVFCKHVLSNLGGYFNRHHSPVHKIIMRPVYLHSTNSGKASTRVFYSNFASKMTQVKPLPTVG